MSGQQWAGKELDKDVLHPYNRVYGPATCCFVSKNLNNFVRLGFKPKHSGLPRGVNFHGPRGTYVARVSINNRRITLGYHKTPEVAEQYYLAGRKVLFNLLARKHHGRIAQGLQRHADVIVRSLDPLVMQRVEDNGLWMDLFEKHMKG
jgi:hypothetical protein